MTQSEDHRVTGRPPLVPVELKDGPLDYEQVREANVLAYHSAWGSFREGEQWLAHYPGGDVILFRIDVHGEMQNTWRLRPSEIPTKGWSHRPDCECRFCN